MNLQQTKKINKKLTKKIINTDPISHLLEADRPLFEKGYARGCQKNA